MLSLQVRQRRVFLRVHPGPSGGATIELAGLARTRLGGPPGELSAIATAIADTTETESRPDTMETESRPRAATTSRE